MAGSTINISFRSSSVRVIVLASFIYTSPCSLHHQNTNLLLIRLFINIQLRLYKLCARFALESQSAPCSGCQVMRHISSTLRCCFGYLSLSLHMTLTPTLQSVLRCDKLTRIISYEEYTQSSQIYLKVISYTPV